VETKSVMQPLAAERAFKLEESMSREHSAEAIEIYSPGSLRVGVQFSWSKKPCIPPSLAVHVFGWRIVHHRVMVCVMRVYLHVS